MFSAEEMDKHFQEQESVNQAVYERAKTVLTPEQLAAFSSFHQSTQYAADRHGDGPQNVRNGEKAGCGCQPVNPNKLETRTGTGAG